jgi:heme A synthase
MNFSKMWDTAVSKPFAYYAWFLVAYTIAVIMWGAYVRATGSGAGCGSHWPTCNGEILHRPEQIETLIELTHRITSAALGIFSIIQIGLAYYLFPKGHIVRKASWAAFGLTVFEGLLGAGLVIFELVAYNTSSLRALVVGFHLVNTLILLAAYTLVAWWASGGPHFSLRQNRRLTAALGIAFAGLLLVGAFGAITALGNTLFPANSLAEGIAQDFDPESHFAIRLRIWHPVIAILTSVYLVALMFNGGDLREAGVTRQLSNALVAVVGLQLVGGFLNVILLAPVWMQMAHLLLADVMWVLLVCYTAVVLRLRPPISSS